MKFTYSYRYWARMVRNPGIVCVPDEFAEERIRSDYFRKPFPVRRGDGSTSRAILISFVPCSRLEAFRTGQAVVKLL